MIQQVLASDEVWAALIGIGAYAIVGFGKHAIVYLKWKITGSNGGNGNGKAHSSHNSNGGNGRVKHCPDHALMAADVAWIKKEHEEKRRVEVIVKAIKQANGDGAALLGGDPRD